MLMCIAPVPLRGRVASRTAGCEHIEEKAPGGTRPGDGLTPSFPSPGGQGQVGHQMKWTVEKRRLACQHPVVGSVLCPFHRAAPTAQCSINKDHGPGLCVHQRSWQVLLRLSWEQQLLNQQAAARSTHRPFRKETRDGSLSRNPTGGSALPQALKEVRRDGDCFSVP